MKRWSIAAMATGALIIGALGVSPAAAAPGSLSMVAFVVDQTCLNGDTVQVDLSAMVDTSSPAKFQWDFTNDGTWDTGRQTSPDATHNYPDEVNVTAEIRGRNQEGNRDSDTVTFSTLRCEG
jgi:hypothetical protein